MPILDPTIRNLQAYSLNLEDSDSKNVPTLPNLVRVAPLECKITRIELVD